MLISAVLLIALYQLLLATEKPFLCSGIYVSVAIFMELVIVGISAPNSSWLVTLLINSAIIFAVTSLYFWLLDRFHDGIGHWIILVLGAVVIFL